MQINANANVDEYRFYGFAGMSPIKEKLIAAKLIDWIRSRNPALYTRIKPQIDMTKLSGMGGILDSIVGIIGKAVKAAPAIFQTKAQINLIKVNLARAKRGLPPIDTSVVTPTVRVQTELSPEVTRKIITAGKAGLNKVLIWSGIGAAALVMVIMFRKK